MTNGAEAGTQDGRTTQTVSTPVPLHVHEQLSYRDGRLHQEAVDLQRLSHEVGTPFYSYSVAGIVEAFSGFVDAFEPHGIDLCFAVKANSNVSILNCIARLGGGADIVSVGELKRAVAAGIRPSSIIFSGAGKTKDEIDAAVAAEVGRINAESPLEVDWIIEAAERHGRRQPVSLRLNPDVSAGTHQKITTGTRDNKFGMLIADVAERFAMHGASQAISLGGVAVHIGSQINSLQPYEATYSLLRRVVLELRSAGHSIEHLSLGGGVGVSYDGAPDLKPHDLARVITRSLGDLDCDLSVELGRALIARAGILVTSVVHVKENGHRTFAFVDAAMNDLMRPALYDARHPILSVIARRGVEGRTYDVVGPVCESSDIFGTGYLLPNLEPGSLIAIRMAGAYGAVMSSTYNSRALIPEVLISDDRHEIVRDRLSVRTQIGWEHVPSWLKLGLKTRQKLKEDSRPAAR